MRKNILILFIIPILAVLCSSGVQANNAGTPPGSFVRHRAVSVSQLAAQVRKDALVRQRYAKHFGIPSQVVADYFDRNLKLISLKKPLRATVWYVSRTGKIQTKTKLLPKGTAVFVDKEGRPVIVWSCGNPLAKKLLVPHKEKEQVKAAPLETTGIETPEETLAPPPAVKTPTTTEELLQPAPMEAVAPPPAIIPDQVVAIPAAIEELPTIAIGGGMSPFLSAALAVTGSVPVIGSIIGGGDSGKGGGGGGETVVPELPGAVIMMAGAGALGLLRRKISTRKR